MTISIIAADDHALFLEGLSTLLQTEDQFKLLATCLNGDDLLAKVLEHKPNIALVDISMPGANTEKIITTLKSLEPKIPVIVLTMHLEAFLAKKLLSLGLSGYISKDTAFEELITAIIKVSSGGLFISPNILKILFEYDKNNTHRNEASLTARELEVLKDVSLGYSNKEIARLLNITERTVRFHLSNCYVKLGAHGRAHAATLATQQLLIT